MPVSSRTELIDYCLRKLGHPVIEINIDDQQIEDRIDDAVQLFREYNADGHVRIYYPITLTSDMITNRVINLREASSTASSFDRILNIVRVLPINAESSSVSFFDVKYQMRLNDLWDLQTGVGDLAYYEQLQQYISTIDMRLTGHPQITFNRRAHQLFIHGDLTPISDDLKEGDIIVIEAFIGLDMGAGGGSAFDDIFLKEISTAFLKKQWGENISKFDGMQLPGGVTINGRQLIEDAKQEIEEIRARMYNEYDTPPLFFMG